MPLGQSIFMNYIHLSIIFSVICLILEMCGIGNEEGGKIIVLLCVSILNWVLHSLKRYFFSRRVQKITHFLE